MSSILVIFTLVQQQMYPGLSALVRVYAPLGPDLIDYLSRIAKYNWRPQAATDWRLDVHAGGDFLDRMRDEPPGGVAIFSGRNRGNQSKVRYSSADYRPRARRSLRSAMLSNRVAGGNRLSTHFSGVGRSGKRR